MTPRLQGHVALVQGASRGIGRGIAECLAREGCDLVITARVEEYLRTAAESIVLATGQRVLWHVADSADHEAAREAIERAVESFGRLDIVVANSGGPPPGGMDDLNIDQWRAAAELLVVAPVELLRAALPLLEKSPAGRFFVVTSSSTREPVTGLLLSNVFRPGIVGMIKALAGELGPKGIRCHSLAPGRIDTDRLGKVIAMQAHRTGISEDDARAAMLAAIPAGRFGKPEDLGQLAAFLASPEADYLTGGNWLVDGGLIKCL